MSNKVTLFPLVFAFFGCTYDKMTLIWLLLPRLALHVIRTICPTMDEVDILSNSSSRWTQKPPHDTSGHVTTSVDIATPQAIAIAAMTEAPRLVHFAAVVRRRKKRIELVGSKRRSIRWNVTFEIGARQASSGSDSWSSAPRRKTLQTRSEKI